MRSQLDDGVGRLMVLGDALDEASVDSFLSIVLTTISL
jgi:hypothetical protein